MPVRVWFWMTWTVRFGPNGSGPEARRCARILGTGSGETQLARHQFPASDSVPFFECSQTARIISCETGPVPILVPGDRRVRFGPNGSGPKASRCARIIRTGSGQHFRAGSGSDANGIRRVYLGILKLERYLTVRYFTPKTTPSPGLRHPFSNHCYN